MGKKVYVGLSGGVDSSVAALLLKDQGYDVTGINLKLTPNGSGDSDRAEKIASHLNIPFKKVDLTREFKFCVLDYFAQEYQNARTPNPCVVCNETIKFGKMLDAALQNGADFLATGHYAKAVLEDGRYKLKRLDVKKDQSYFLHRLTQRQLSHVLFPINMPKERVRKLAQEAGLITANLPDSQEICFIKNGDYANFILEYTGKASLKGRFIDRHGNCIGDHRGIIHYTVGQRKGLGVSFGEPMYVTKIDPLSNDITLGSQDDLLTSSCIVQNINYISVNGLYGPVKAHVKIRFLAPPVKALVTPLSEEGARIDFEEPQKAVTPGQCAVFYDDDDNVIGGGFISG
ncbi:MAG: tRNA 2-thiouridine(34) synthase MnmA [Oscillospiraceae bacterium]|nr:tRNA 2-thiouridine(34) synthase MnmA [Oscillospiraceae bacterium]